MGYWNGWSNYEEWYQMSHNKGKICQHCGSEYWPVNAVQMYCKEPSCRDDRYFQKLWDNDKHPLQKYCSKIE